MFICGHFKCPIHHGRDISSFKIEKLDNGKIYIWKPKLELTLAFKQLDHVIEYDPRAEKSRNNYEEWRKVGKKAKAVIGLTLNDGHLEHVHGTETATVIWGHFAKISSAKSCSKS